MKLCILKLQWKQQNSVFLSSLFLLNFAEDTRPPSITGCPLTQTVNVEAGTDEVQVIWTEPTASDTSGLVSLLSNNYNSGDVFSVGDTIVEYVFVDAHGNQAVCSFIVRVTAGEFLSFSLNFQCACFIQVFVFFWGGGRWRGNLNNYLNMSARNKSFN